MSRRGRSVPRPTPAAVLCALSLLVLIAMPAIPELVEALRRHL